MLGRPTIKLSKETVERGRALAQARGYSSLDELVEHLLQQEFDREDQGKVQETGIKDRLKGLGYL